MFSIFKRKGHVAHMGDENTLYFNKELNRWVERGKENEAVEESVPPPPVSGPSTGIMQRMGDRADPSSRYVAAGGFGGATALEKRPLAPPPKPSTAPPVAGGFFMPVIAQPASPKQPEPEATSPSSPQKYKGFRIPTFIKPEEFGGTREEYEAAEAAEVEKWKAKIDRKQRKKEGKSPLSGENGISATKSGKLEDNWLTEDSDPFSTGAFGFSAEDQGDHLDLFPVQPEGTQNYQPEIAPEEIQDLQPEVVLNEAFANNGVAESNGIDLHGKEGLVEEATMNGILPEEDQLGAAEEIEFPAAVRDSNDPEDTAWLLGMGWTNQDQSLELTRWLNQNYQDSWRAWDEAVWSGFWDWYYVNGGCDVIHPAVVEADDHKLSNGTQIAYNDKEADAEFFEEPQGVLDNAEVEDTVVHDSRVDESAAAFFDTGLASELVQESDLTHSLRPQSTEQTQELVMEEEFVPEDDEAFWGVEEEEQVQPMAQEEKEPVAPVVPANEESDLKLKEERNFTTVSASSKAPTTKLSSWEDEFLFSIPDPWESVQSDDEDSTDMRLPFAIFSHQGMLQFLEAVIAVLSKGDQSSATKFRNQVYQLVEAVQASTKTAPEVTANPGMGLFKTNDEESLKAEFEIERAEWRDKLEKASSDIDELRQSVDSQQRTIDDLTMKLEQYETDIQANKEELDRLNGQLEKKEETLELLQKEITFKDEEILSIRDQFKDSDVSGEVNTMQQEILALKKSLQEEIESKEQITDDLHEILKENEAELEKKKDWLPPHRLEESQSEIRVLKSKVAELEFQLSERPAVDNGEVDLLKKQIQELESRDHEGLARQVSRLEQNLSLKEDEIGRLNAQLDGLAQKDKLISKLSASLNDKDLEIEDLRKVIEGSNLRQSDLIEKLAAKDVDLENVVRSLIFSQKQVSRLCSYCHELGGEPTQCLASLTVAE